MEIYFIAVPVIFLKHSIELRFVDSLAIYHPGFWNKEKNPGISVKSVAQN